MQYDYKKGREIVSIWALTRPLAVTIAALVPVVVAPLGSAEAQHGETAITCKNSSSGTTWQIKVDYDHSTVDSNPASISDGKISWRDAKDGWRYRLDLSTGELYVVFASSMGGNTYFHHCQLDH
jgi:hypothetical protein